jgi:hypothetical protein
MPIRTRAHEAAQYARGRPRFGPVRRAVLAEVYPSADSLLREIRDSVEKAGASVVGQVGAATSEDGETILTEVPVSRTSPRSSLSDLGA